MSRVRCTRVVRRSSRRSTSRGRCRPWERWAHFNRDYDQLLERLLAKPTHRAAHRATRRATVRRLPRNLLSELVLFLLYLASRRPRRLEWDPDGKRSDGKPATVLHLFDALPRPPFRLVGGTPLHVTSEHERLLPEHFGAAAADVNKVGAWGHGRTLTCLDPRTGPVAALAYHLEDDAPLLVMALAVLETGDHGAEETSRSLAGVLLCYLARAGLERELPPRLGFAPSKNERALAQRLGFYSTAPPAAYADAGRRYMEWTAPRPLKL